MKKLFVLLIGLACVVSTSAQFSSDANDPLAICNAGSQQNSVKAVDDEFSLAGGYFVFWLDKRTDGTKSNLYGQRLDKDGNVLWETNGRLIVSTDYTISALQVVKWQQGLLLSYIVTNVFYDTVKCIYLDSEGQNQWSAPAVVALSNTVPPFLAVESGGCFNILPTATGATITYYLIYFGGAGAIAYNKIDFNGNVLLANNAMAYTLSGYDYRSLSDGQDGLYILSKGNGVGSTMTIDKINANGTSDWVNGLEITGGGGPFGFAGNISMNLASNKDLYVTWDAYNNTIYTTKILNTGGFAWPTTRIGVSNSGASSTGRSFARINSSDSLCITWIESSVSVSNVMLQKIGSSGGLSLPVGGKIVGEANGTYAYPKLAQNNENAVCFFSTTTNTVALGAQSIKPDNTLNWAATKILSSAYYKWSFYQDFVVLNSNDDCNAIFWTGFDENIYGASTCKIADIMPLVSGSLFVQNFGSKNKISWKVYNQSVGDSYEVHSSNNGVDFITIATIPAIEAERNYYFWDENPVQGTNYYRVKIKTVDGKHAYSNIVNTFVKEIKTQMIAYPNPVKNMLTIQIGNASGKNAVVSISDMDGRILKRVPVYSQSTTINMTGFVPGIYYVKYQDDTSSEVIKILKQ